MLYFVISSSPDMAFTDTDYVCNMCLKMVNIYAKLY